MPLLDALIIGAGPSGLAAAACLSRAGLQLEVLERSDAVGSAWRGHYERLRLHTVKRFSHLPYMRFPREYPRYVPRARFVEYLERYAQAFSIRPQLGQDVRSARYDGSRWAVETQDRAYHAKRLIVATGYNRRPRIPTFAGQERFTGEIFHASTYKTGRDYRGKRVLVVGMGNTGAEIGLDLVEQGAVDPAISVRSPVHVLPREFLGLPSQVTGLLLSRVPIRVADRMGVRVSKLAFGDLAQYGIERPAIGPLSQVVEHGRIPVLDVGTIAAIKAGRLAVLPDIDRFEEDAVVFTDGTKKPFEVVVLATGYAAALDEFLEPAAEVTDARGYPKVHGAQSSVPGLYFLGYRNPPVGGLFDINREARAIAREIKKYGAR